MLKRGQAAAGAAALGASHAEYPAFVHIYPGGSRRSRALLPFFEAAVRDAIPFGTVYAATENGVVLGIAVWLPPGAFPWSSIRKVRATGAFMKVWAADPAGRRVIEMPVTPTTKPVSASGTFLVGGDLPVYRLGFSAMRITGPGVWYPVAVGKLARSDGPLSEIGAEAGATPIQMALAWLLKRSEVMLPIPGTGSVAHRDENLGAAQVALTEDQFRRIDAAVSQAL